MSKCIENDKRIDYVNMITQLNHSHSPDIRLSFHGHSHYFLTSIQRTCAFISTPFTTQPKTLGTNPNISPSPTLSTTISSKYICKWGIFISIRRNCPDLGGHFARQSIYFSRHTHSHNAALRSFCDGHIFHFSKLSLCFFSLQHLLPLSLFG